MISNTKLIGMHVEDFVILITNQHDAENFTFTGEDNIDNIVFSNTQFLFSLDNNLFDRIQVNGQLLKKINLVFDNCSFVEDFDFKWINGNSKQLKFTNCNFNKNVKIYQSINHVGLINVIIDGNLEITDTNGYARFEKIIIKGDFIINSLKTDLFTTSYMNAPIKQYTARLSGPPITRFIGVEVKGNLEIYNSIFGVLLFIKVRVDSTCKIQDCRVTGNLDISNCEFKNLEISHRPGRYNLYEYPFMVVQALLIDDVVTHQTLTLRVSSKTYISLSQSKIKYLNLDIVAVLTDLILDKCDIEGGNLKSIKIINKFHITNCAQLSFSTTGEIRSDTIIISNNKKGTVQITNARCNCILLTGILNKDFSIEMTSIQANNIRFEKFNNIGIFNINSLELIKSKFKLTSGLIEANDLSSNMEQLHIFNNADEDETTPVMEIVSSDLGKMFFTNCNIPIDTDFIFTNSRIIDISLFATSFPEISVYDQSALEQGINQKRQVYSQFKKVYESKGDSIEALNYQRLELEAYRQWLILKKLNSPERLVLKFNRWTNNYGTDWLLSLKMLFIGSISSYVIYCLLYGFWPGWPINWQITGQVASYYFEYVFPIRRPDFLDTYILEKKPFHNESYQSVARVVDYFSRIITSILGYQLVQAFRKHGKR